MPSVAVSSNAKGPQCCRAAINVTNVDAEKSFEGGIEVGKKYYEIIKESNCMVGQPMAV